MTTNKRGLIRAIWDGPFYIGPLSRPVSVGDVLLKSLETLWRILVVTGTALLLVVVGILVWSKFIEPTFFPPLESQVAASATYDDGNGQAPTVSDKTFRCDPDYPIRIAFKNNSNKTIGKLNFSIEGRAANRTDNVVLDGAWKETDVIVPAGRTALFCWSVAVKSSFDAKALDYSIEVHEAIEADPNAKFSPLPQRAAPSPVASASATPTPAPSPALALGTIKDSDWNKIGMGCACSFSAGSPNKVRLIAGGDDLAFFRLNGEERLCTAPGTEALFDGAVSLACGSTAVQVTPYGATKPGYDGHSSSARLNITDSKGTLTLKGTWGCSC